MHYYRQVFSLVLVEVSGYDAQWKATPKSLNSGMSVSGQTTRNHVDRFVAQNALYFDAS